MRPLKERRTKNWARRPGGERGRETDRTQRLTDTHRERGRQTDREGEKRERRREGGGGRGGEREREIDRDTQRE